MKLNPMTLILIILEWGILTFSVPFNVSFMLLTAMLLAVLIIPSSTDLSLVAAFMKILFVASLFLVALHGINWFPPRINHDGIELGLRSFLRIAVPVTGVLFLSRRIQSEELFALLVDLKVPSSAVFILFRTIWLVPRLISRTDEVVTALRFRGVRVSSPLDRLKAVTPALTTIFSSMVSEISDNSLTLTARGFLLPGRKTHLTPVYFTRHDIIALFISTGVNITIWRLTLTI